MKRRFYLILLFAAVALSGMAQTVGESMYIYRSNGQINGFLPEEIESIDYSYYDIEGNKYDEIVMQIVNTVDSVYKIPLADIDSVSFVNPKTIYKSDVILISDELINYVVGHDSLNIIFDEKIPDNIIPKIGEKLLLMERTKMFPMGFSGEIINIKKNGNNYNVECKHTTIDDLFETFYCVKSLHGYQQAAESRASSYRIDKEFSLGTFTATYSAELSNAILSSSVTDSELAYKTETSFTVETTPSFHVRGTFIHDKEHGTYVSSVITGDITIKRTLSVSGGLEYSDDFLKSEIELCPVIPGVITLYLKPGAFVRANGAVSSSGSLTQNYSTLCAFDFSTKGENILNNTGFVKVKSSSFETQICLEGSLAAGGFIEFGFGFPVSSKGKICFRGELGAEVKGNVVLYDSEIDMAKRETNVYEKLKKSKISNEIFISGQTVISALGLSLTQGITTPLYSADIHSLVPSFSNILFKQLASNRSSAKVKIDMLTDEPKGCLFPIKTGFKILDKNYGLGQYYISEDNYKEGTSAIEETAKDLSERGEYVLYPAVNFMGFDLLASPESSLQKCRIKANTGTYTDLEKTSVCIYGSIDDFDNEASEGDVYVLYGTNSNLSVDNSQKLFVAKLKDLVDGAFQRFLSGLDAGTTYYYATLLQLGQENYLGEIREFVTENDIMIINESVFDITDVSAVVTGRIYGLDENEDGKVYICYGTNMNLNKNVDTLLPLGTLKTIGDYFYASLENLSSNTYYYYMFLIELENGNEICGYVGSFITDKEKIIENLYCPDNNHPHIIDLGLPSGTKWACCNVGASRPDDFGGYYAWGETKQKSYYDWSTYEFKSENGYEYIGSDISGTAYDAATVNWGAPWKMPSVGRCEELIRSTTISSATVNGVYGCKFTGRNGSTIFIPGAGNKLGTEIYAPYSVECWTSSLFTQGQSNAHDLYCSGDEAGIFNDSRRRGKTIRPIYSK